MASELSPSRKRQIVDEPENAENVDPNIPSSSVVSSNKQIRLQSDKSLDTSAQRVETLISEHLTESSGSGETVNPVLSGNDIFVAWLEAKFGLPSATSEPKNKPEKRPRREKVYAVPKKRLTKMERIDKMLSEMGVDPETSSFCVKAAIYKGIIKITGDPAELKMVVHEGVASCGHYVEATLEDVLKQPDYIPKTGEDTLNWVEMMALHSDTNSMGPWMKFHDDENEKLRKLQELWPVICKETPPDGDDYYFTMSEEDELEEDELEELVEKRKKDGRATSYWAGENRGDVETGARGL